VDGAVEAVLRLGATLRALAHLRGLADMAEAANGLEREPDVHALDDLVREVGRLLASPTDCADLVLVHPREELVRLISAAASSYAETVHVAHTVREAFELLGRLEKAPGAFLLATELPDGDGRDVLAHVRRDPLVSASPVFMLGRRDAWTVTESLALGALAVFDDPSHQVLQISNAVAAVMGFEERMNLEMLFDPLTGVLAAEDFRDAVDRMGEDYSLFRAGAWSLAIVTVQNFALIDDACGRQAAEGAVLAVLDLVRDLVPESATLGRLHANQIAVMLADVGADAAQELLGRLPAAAPDWSARGKDGLTYRALLVSGAVEAGGTTARETLRAAAQAVAMATPGNPGHIERYGDERADLVLLAEDSPPVARLVTLLLERVGLRVVHRDDGEAALNVALTSTDARFALIMLDLNLPTMDGFEILRRIRAEKRLANVPVVLITSSDTDRHKVAGLDAGADDYITKPFNADVFLARVRNVLRRGRVDPAAQVGAVPLDLDDEDLDDDAFEVFEGDAE